MKNWMKGIFTLVLLTGIVSVVAVSCSDDDEAEIVCADANATKVTLGPNCKEFIEEVCACSPLPGGLTQADCDLAAQGQACVTPDEPAEDDATCKTDHDELDKAVEAYGKPLCTLLAEFEAAGS